MTRTTRCLIVGTGLMLGVSPALAAADEDRAYQRVEFVTTDGVTVVGDYYPPTGRMLAPPVILLHMYGHDRTSWAPMYEVLHNGGFAVLSIDLRGHGESVKPEEMNLSQRAKDRDSALFNDMYKDVDAAVKWVRQQPNVHPEKLALAGASVGCSVAIHYTSMHDGKVSAVACLSPGTDYLGVNSLEHIAKIEKTPILLVGGKPDLEACEALRAKCETVTHRGGGGKLHGTDMLGKAKRVERRIADFLFENTFQRGPKQSGG